MKFTIRRALKLLVIGGAAVALVAWAPPTNEDIVVNTGSPAISLGTSNSFSGKFGMEFRGFVAGTSNEILTGPDHYSGIIGVDNFSRTKNSLTVGNSNKVAQYSATPNTFVSNSAVVGDGNIVRGGSDATSIFGKANTVLATNGLVSGSSNVIEGEGADTAFHSAAIGFANNIKARTAWAIGADNTVAAHRAIALGTGLSIQSRAPNCLAVGVYNAPVNGGTNQDLFVVGNGTGAEPTDRSTALRVTQQGDVILGKAQGDISMGAYGN